MAFFAYIAVICAATAFALGALYVFGRTTVTWLDDMRRPVESRGLPTTQDVSFRMLPHGVPASIKSSGAVDRF